MNNNPRFDTSNSKSPDSLRTDIDTTRRRMDDTIDALSSRLKGRHLIDEILGFFRSSSGNGNGGRIKSKVTESATSAMHATLDTVKAHPVPALLIGTGIAYMIYEKRRASSDTRLSYDPDYDARRQAEYTTAWDEDVPYDYPASEYPIEETGIVGASDIGGTSTPTLEEEEEGRRRGLKEKVGEKASAVGERIRNSSSHLKERSRARARELGQRVQAGYAATRQRVSSTADQRPLESAIACLALGIVAGLAMPLPRAIGEATGPTAERLRRRARETGRDLIERGKHVAQAAASAAREEAESQGLTPEALREKAGSVAERAREAATETAESEGIKASPSGSGGSSPGRQPSEVSTPPASSPGF